MRKQGEIVSTGTIDGDTDRQITESLRQLLGIKKPKLQAKKPKKPKKQDKTKLDVKEKPKKGDDDEIKRDAPLGDDDEIKRAEPLGDEFRRGKPFGEEDFQRDKPFGEEDIILNTKGG